MAAQDYVSVVQQLYISYFGRPADYFGLKNYTERLEALKAPTDFTALNALVQADKAGTTELSKLVNSFSTSPEAIALYGTDNSNLGISKFLVAVFENVLGRTPELGPGWDFWFNALASGNLRRADAAMAITEGAINNTTPQGLIDAALVQKKNAVSTAFTNALDTPAKINAYSTKAAIDIAVGMLDGVTATTDVAAYQPTIVAAVDAVVISNIPTVISALTTGIDSLPGSVGNDVFNAVINGDNSTLTTLDTINGAGGNDVLNLDVVDTDSATAGNQALTQLPAVTVTSVETVNVRGATAVTANFSSWTGTTAVNVTQAADDVAITGASTTALSVAGALKGVALEGGASQTVTTAGEEVKLGATTVTTGAIKVTHTAQAANVIEIDGGSTVTVNSTGSSGASTIKVGQGGAASDLATGAVSVTSNHDGVLTGATVTMADITVTGGTTITVNQTGASADAAAKAVAADEVALGDVTITGSTKTTTVSVSQTASTASALAQAAVAGKTETASVKFGALKAGDSLTLSVNGDTTADVGELTFKADKDMTAAEVAAAFSNLVNLDTQSNGPAKNGEYTHAASLWTSAAASGDTVVFTSTTADSNVTDLKVVLTDANADSTAAVVTTTDGAGATAAATGKLGVIDGKVVINDNTTAASITKVTVDGYGNASTIGATTALSKLTDLSLANSGGATAGATNGTMTVHGGGITSLNLTVNAVKGTTSLDGTSATVKTLNLKATGADSTFALVAAVAETLTVSGDKAVSLTGDLEELKTVTVTGTAGLTLAAAAANKITSINTTGTTGAVTSNLDAGVGTYTGGAGKDTVTLETTTALTKAIDLGAGDDTLSFNSLTVTGTTATLKGGAGTDTLSMTSTAADGLDNSTVFASQVSGFERLTINNVYGDADASADTLTLDLANLGGYNYVTTSGTLDDGANDDILVLNKMASGGTVVLTATGLINVGVTDAATGTADSLNVVLSSSGALTAGTLTAADVETINITATDTNTTAHVDLLTLTAGAAKTVTVSGNAGLTLTMTGSTAVTKIDGSAMTKGLTVTSVNTTEATTITGGAGNDQLTAATGTTADVLIGGAGNDTLIANKGLNTLTGGAGADTFVVGVASLNSSSYATITDFGTSDLIKFTGAEKFTSTKVTQADTAVFQDYANAAMNAIALNDVAWFQFNGNTYIVMDAANESATFVNGEDFIVKLTGLVDLTNATFNDTSDTIGIF